MHGCRFGGCDRSREGIFAMAKSRRAVFVCCDGLGRDWVRPETTPVLDALRRDSLWCADHRGVFPSVTRVSAASIATGCQPARHGLHGNRMGLFEDGRIVVRDVGAPDFRDHMRRATGRTLHVPALAGRGLLSRPRQFRPRPSSLGLVGAGRQGDGGDAGHP
jgi:Type I phosphodiesterase / nucleotide pyrophosphatase